MNPLPVEVIQHILSFLSPYEVTRLRQVSLPSHLYLSDPQPG